MATTLGDLELHLLLNNTQFGEGIKSSLVILDNFQRQAKEMLELKGKKPDFAAIDAEILKTAAAFKQYAKGADDAEDQQDEFNKTNKNTENTVKSTRMTLVQFWRDVGMAYQGIRSMFYDFGMQLKKTVDEYALAELSNVKLQNSLKNLGEEDAFERLSEKAKLYQDNVGFFTQENIQDAMTLLATYGKTADEIETLIPRMLNLTAATKGSAEGELDLMASGKLLGRINEESLGMLERYIGKLSQETRAKLLSAERGEQLAMVTQMLDERFGGFSNTLGNSTAGKIERVKREFEDLYEVFGEGVVKGNEFFDGLNNGSKETEELGQKVDITEGLVKGLGYAFEFVVVEASLLGAAREFIQSIETAMTAVKNEGHNVADSIRGIAAVLDSNPNTSFFSVIYDAAAETWDMVAGLLGTVESLEGIVAKKSTVSEDGGVSRGGDMEGITIPGVANVTKKKTGGKGGKKEKKEEDKTPLQELYEELKKETALLKKMTEGTMEYAQQLVKLQDIQAQINILESSADRWKFDPEKHKIPEKHLGSKIPKMDSEQLSKFWPDVQAIYEQMHRESDWFKSIQLARMWAQQMEEVMKTVGTAWGQFWQDLAAGDIHPLKAFLKSVLSAYLTSVQAMLLASAAAMSGKAIPSFGLSLIKDAPLMAAAWVALEAAKGLLSGFAEGGRLSAGGKISGPGTPTSDSILAISGDRMIRLSDQEYIVPAWMDFVMPWLETIRTGGKKSAGFAAGGSLGVAMVNKYAPGAFMDLSSLRNDVRLKPGRVVFTQRGRDLIGVLEYEQEIIEAGRYSKG